MENAAIAQLLAEMADIAEVRGDNPFRIRALRTAAAAIESLPYDLAPLCDDPQRLQEIKGIGGGIARKVIEICKTGSSTEHQELLAQFPPTLLELLRLEGVGPKKVRLFHDALGVRSIEDLEAAARAQKLRALPRMSAAAEAKILQAIAAHHSRSGRFLISTAEQSVERVLAMLRAIPGVRRAEAAGSFRRGRETVGDLDFLVACGEPGPVMDRFSGAGSLIMRGETKCSIKLAAGMQADLRIVPEESFGAALHYFTGSKAHNVAIRGMAQKKGLTINEYGVFRTGEDGSPLERLYGEREEDVFAAVGLPWIPPELREERGEIEAGLEGRLPRLLDLRDIRGDVHLHTTASDGTASIEEMAQAAFERGLRYIAITDHSKALAMVRGLDEARLRDHCAAVAAVEAALGRKIRLLKGVEVDILRDGELDLAAEALRELDVVVASIHSHFQMPREEMTARVLRAIESGAIDILGHPTGRLLLRREPFALDMERVMRATRERGVALESSAFPDRLDLSDLHCRMAKEMGVKVVINTDSHAVAHLDLMRFGVLNARRGWLEAGEVLNTHECDEFLKLLHDGHR